MEPIDDLPSWVAAVREQPGHHRFLFMFVRMELPENPDPVQVAEHQSGEAGVLTPVLAFDRDPDAVEGMDDLARTAGEAGVNWDLVLAGVIAGEDGLPPTDEAASRALEWMMELIHTGGDLSQLVCMDRSGAFVGLG